MPVIRCKCCGGALNIQENVSVVVCEYCDLKQTLPNMSDEECMALFENANLYRSRNDFDKATLVYTNIISKKKDEAEAYWGLCLCRYGIEYVTDPATGNKIPTCHRTQFKSILDDEDYKKAIENADLLQQQVYEEEANYIDKVQKGILSISSKEEPFDIFICYKETDERGGRTIDSVVAQDIYDKLTKEGYKVFFARITLEDKLGSAYEPYIFAALNSAKIMLVIGTKPENFEAIWVKNEWSRYIELIEQGKEKVLIPCYRDMNPYDLPNELGALQSQDLGKIGAMQDLVRGIQKIHNIDRDAQNDTPPNIDVNSLMAGNANSILKRGYMSLEEGEFKKATDCFNRCLDINPESSEAYWGLVLIDANCKNDNELINKGIKIKDTSEYRYALRFADKAQKERYESAENKILHTINTMVSTLKSKQQNVIETGGIKAGYEKGIQKVAKADAEVSELLNNLQTVENNIREQSKKCKTVLSGWLQNMYNNSVMPYRQMKDELRAYMNGVTDNDKEIFIQRMNAAKENLNICMQNIEHIKNNSEEFRTLRGLIDQHKDLIKRISAVKQSGYDQSCTIFNDYVSRLKKMNEQYKKAIDAVYSGDYTSARDLLSR